MKHMMVIFKNPQTHMQVLSMSEVHIPDSERSVMPDSALTKG